LSCHEDLELFDDSVLGLRSASTADRIVIAVALVVGLSSMKVFGGLQGSELRGNASMMLIGLAIMGICGLPALCRIVGARAKQEMDATWHALQVFCHSPPTVPPGSRAPWSARSRYGDAGNRRAPLCGA